MLAAARRRPFGALHYRPYATIWLGAFLSNIGTWMETVAVGVYVTETTGKAGWTGTIAALVYLPTLGLGTVGGALADRFDRRRYLLTMTLVQAVLAGVLGVLAHLNRLSLGVMSLLMFLTGCASTLLGPAFSAFLAELVPREEHLSALSLSSAQFNLARVVGPVVAAAVIGLGGYSWAFAVNAVSFLAVLVALTQVQPPPTQAQEHPQALWEDIKRGVTVAWGDPGIRVVLGLTLAASTLISPFIGLIPAYAIKVFREGARGTSLLMTFQGVGAVLAALSLGIVAEMVGRRRVLETAALCLGPLAMIYWLAPIFTAALLALAVLGAAYLSVTTSSHTSCQARVPRNLQARASSLFGMVLGVGYAIGLTAQGWLGDAIGLRGVTASASGLFFLIMLGLRLHRPDHFKVLDELSPLLTEESQLPPVLVADPGPQHEVDLL